MASISDFDLFLVDGGLNFSTTDTNFHGGGDVVFLLVKNASWCFNRIGRRKFLCRVAMGHLHENSCLPSFPINLEFYYK